MALPQPAVKHKRNLIPSSSGPPILGRIYSSSVLVEQAADQNNLLSRQARLVVHWEMQGNAVPMRR